MKFLFHRAIERVDVENDQVKKHVMILNQKPPRGNIGWVRHNSRRWIVCLVNRVSRENVAIMGYFNNYHVDWETKDRPTERSGVV